MHLSNWVNYYMEFHSWTPIVHINLPAFHIKEKRTTVYCYDTEGTCQRILLCTEFNQKLSLIITSEVARSRQGLQIHIRVLVFSKSPRSLSFNSRIKYQSCMFHECIFKNVSLHSLLFRWKFFESRNISYVFSWLNWVRHASFEKMSR